MSERKELPVAGQGGAESRGGAPGGGSQPPAAAEVPSWRLIATLALAGAMAGLMIVTVFEWAQPRILDHQARVLATAVDEVLAGPERVERYFVQPDGLLGEPTAGMDTIGIPRVFLGYDGNGQTIGFAIVGSKPGFQDVIQVIFGYDPSTNEVLGMRVLESKETPGLGDKIFKDLRFVRGFEGVLAPIRPVGEGAGSGEPNEAELITGATISARVVVDIINERVAALDDRLTTHLVGGVR
jgi:Na+-translocating ferredoxin:NAD+ oxidoreductase subunit G